MTLLTALKDTFSTDVITTLAEYVDEPFDKTQKAVDALTYTLLGGLMKRTSSDIGITQLFNHLQKNHYTGQALERLVPILSDPTQAQTLLAQGNDSISHLLPALKSSVGQMVSRYAGLRNSSAITLFSLVSAICLHTLGRITTERKVDADGLASMVMGERDSFANTAPDDLLPQLIERLGLQSVLSSTTIPARRSVDVPATNVTRQPVTFDMGIDRRERSSAWSRWGIGALVVVAVGLIGYYIYQNTQKHLSDLDTVISADSVGSDSVARSLDVPFDSVQATQPSATTAAASQTLTTQLTPYLDNVTLPKGRIFSIPSLTFQPGSLTLTPQSQPVITELVQLLKKYPRLQVQFIGFANDGTAGMSDFTLSYRRANIVKQQIVNAGINYLRIDAIGRGTGLSAKGAPADSLRQATVPQRKIDMRVVAK